MITEIRLNGILGKKVGRKIWRLEVSSVAEATHAINAMTRGKLYRAIMGEEERTQGYHVQCDERTIGEGLLTFNFGPKVIRITPILQGADTKGVLTIVAGAALIAIGLVSEYYFPGNPWGVQLVGLGLAIALGGVARLLTSSPAQNVGSADKNRSSYIFGGAVNTVSQGECVPVAYGNPWTGSAVAAAGIESVDINV